MSVDVHTAGGAAGRLAAVHVAVGDRAGAEQQLGEVDHVVVVPAVRLPLPVCVGNTGYEISGLKTIFNKGVGAYKTNPKSVRPSVKSPEQWAFARVYAAIDPASKAHKIDRIHLVKRRA